MDAETALSRLTIMTQASVDPGLTADELDMLLVTAETADDDLIEPGEEGWVPTYSVSGLRTAAGQGWLLKAGKASADFEVSVGTGKSFKLQQVHDMCLTMAGAYGVGPLATGSSRGGSGIGSVGVYTLLGEQPA